MRPDLVIVGGGIAGAASALRLGMAGHRVELFERERTAHDKVCGEFLSHEAAAELALLGLTPARLGAAQISAVRLVAGRTIATAGLPGPAWGLSRRRLDDWLLNEASRHGVAVRRGVTVHDIAADGAGAHVVTDAGDSSVAAALLATGKRDLRAWRRAGASDLIGLKLHLWLAVPQRRAVAGHVELALFAGGYAGLQLVEEDRANLCLLVSRARFAALGRDWRELVATVPHLALRLAGAQTLHAHPLAVAGMPYGWLSGGDGRAPVYRIGDQAAVIPSFTGDGMAMALRSTHVAAEAILAGRSAMTFQRMLETEFRRPMWRAGFLARLISAPRTHQLLVATGQLVPWLISRIVEGTRLGPRLEPG